MALQTFPAARHGKLLLIGALGLGLAACASNERPEADIAAAQVTAIGVTCAEATSAAGRSLLAHAARPSPSAPISSSLPWRAAGKVCNAILGPVLLRGPKDVPGPREPPL